MDSRARFTRGWGGWHGPWIPRWKGQSLGTSCTCISSVLVGCKRPPMTPANGESAPYSARSLNGRALGQAKRHCLRLVGRESGHHAVLSGADLYSATNHPCRYCPTFSFSASLQRGWRDIG